MKKRFFAALLALAMVVVLLPGAALAADVSGDYPMDFTETYSQSWAGNKIPATEDCSGTGWSWSFSSKTLTLTGLNFTTRADIALTLPAGATIIVSGANSFTANNSLSTIIQDQSYGIYAKGALTVTGSGSLSATGASADFSGGISCGVRAAGGIEVTGVALTGTGKVSGDSSIGVNSTGNIRVSGAGALTGTSGASTHGNSIGVSALGHDIAVESGSRLNGAGDGTDDVDGWNSFGIECGSLRVTGNGSRATGASKTAGRDSMAMYVLDQSVPIGPGTITGNVLAPAGGVIGDWTDWGGTSIRTVLAANGEPATAATIGIDDAGADVPKTGDGSTPLLWAGLLLLAGVGLIVLRKRRTEGD